MFWKVQKNGKTLHYKPSEKWKFLLLKDYWIEHVFFEILIPKFKPITVGIFHRPPNSNDFLNLLSNHFQQIDLNKKEIYLLGDFNINLFQNGKFLLKENQSNQVKDPISPLISKYKEFYQSFSLTEIIKEPTWITCSTAALLDHILRNCAEKISRKGESSMWVFQVIN